MVYQEVVKTCSYLLNNFPEAQYCKNYLNNRVSQQSQELFELGYFPNLQYLSILIDLVGEELLLKTELLKYYIFENINYPAANKKETILFFQNHPILIPFKNPYGEIVGLIGRSILPDSELKELKVIKYKNTADSDFFKKGNLLFGLYENKQNILRNDSVFIVEGQFDVIKATEKGFNNIVALGNSNMTAYQFSVICRYTNNIYLLLDNDEAGNKGRQRIMNKFSKFANIKNYYLPPEYKDIDEFFKENSCDLLIDYLKYQ